ncbi:MAG: EamA family transporter [Chitinivibrionales bacterium]|nr:EamA family transporter [Chitinivibrionales bacterium]MBD3358314.1 EamA family transporter [Chitinivibrionales bacterium]
MIVGIFLGLTAATFQSLSYLFTRWFVTTYDRSAVPLLIMGHILMGTLSLAALPFLWPSSMPPPLSYLPALAQATLFYLIGQSALTITLQRTQASRLAPLLGTKVLVLAMISMVFYDTVLSANQWFAVLLSVTAATLLSRIGGAISPGALAGIAIACIGYSLSDINIRRLVLTFTDLSLAHATSLGVCLIYLISGGIALFGISRKYTRTMWVHAVPYALSWFAGMFFLFGTFATIGVVYGNIVQSSRGLISIVLGVVVARAGFVTVEQHAGAGTTIRRTTAAILMITAIVLFYLGKR